MRARAAAVLLALAVGAALALAPEPANAGPLVGVVAGVLASALGIGLTLAKVIVSVVVAVALAAAQFFLTPKPKKPSGLSAFAAEAQQLTVEIRQPTAARKYVVGEARVGGVWVYADVVSNDRNLWMVFYLCQGPVEAIPVVLLDDYPIYPSDLDGDGLVTTGRYANKIRIKKHLGATDQAADADLVAASSEWTTDHRLRGCAYLVVEFIYDRKAFAQGRPQVTALVRGSKFVDPRDADSPQVAAWTPNATVALRGYLTTAKAAGGYGCADDEVNAAAAIVAANVCDEIVDTEEASHTVVAVNTGDGSLDLSDDVLAFQTGDRLYVSTDGTLPSGLSGDPTRYYAIVDHIRRREDSGSTTRYPRIRLAASLDDAIAGTAVAIADGGTGTHTVTKDGEPRYWADGVVDTAKDPGTIVRELLTAMGGRAVWTGGEFVLHAAAWQAASLTFSEGDFRGPVTVATKHSRHERYNGLKGNYAGPDNLYQPTTYPPLTSAAFEAEDNGDRILFDYDLPYTARASAAPRLAKIELYRHRRQTSASIPMKLRGYQAAAAGTVAIDYDNRGWSGRTFEVTAITLETVDGGDGPYLGTQLELSESDSAVFDWDHSVDEQPVNRPSPSTLGDPTDVVAPAIGTLESGTDRLYTKDDGTIVSRLYIPWSESADSPPSADPFLDGWEVAVKKSADADYPPAVRISADQTFHYQWDVEDGVSYDARVRAVNQIGRRSDWSEATGHTIVGKTAAPSDVASISAQQNGAVVTVRIDRITDADRNGYEFRYMAAPFDWDVATVLAEEPKGTELTTVSVPPGAWVIGVKAKDTSGNYSTNATTVALTVTNQQNVVATASSAPRWPGTRTNLVKHDVSGTLIPDSNTLAADMTDTELWDTFVHDPVASASYEAKEIDLGFDADGVRAWAIIGRQRGPGETQDPVVATQFDYRDEAVAYDGFEDWTIGTFDGRRAKFKVVMTPSAGAVGALNALDQTLDVPDREETGDDLVVAAPGPESVTFAQPFHAVPNVQVTPDGNSALIPVKENVSATGFDVRVFDSGGNNVGGTVDWRAVGH